MGKFNLMKMTHNRVKRAAHNTPLPTSPKVIFQNLTKRIFLQLFVTTSLFSTAEWRNKHRRGREGSFQRGGTFSPRQEEVCGGPWAITTGCTSHEDHRQEEAQDCFSYCCCRVTSRCEEFDPSRVKYNCIQCRACCWKQAGSSGGRGRFVPPQKQGCCLRKGEKFCWTVRGYTDPILRKILQPPHPSAPGRCGFYQNRSEEPDNSPQPGLAELTERERHGVSGLHSPGWENETGTFLCRRSKYKTCSNS